jgi:hypothetical protein
MKSEDALLAAAISALLILMVGGVYLLAVGSTERARARDKFCAALCEADRPKCWEYFAKY